MPSRSTARRRKAASSSWAPRGRTTPPGTRSGRRSRPVRCAATASARARATHTAPRPSSASRLRTRSRSGRGRRSCRSRRRPARRRRPPTGMPGTRRPPARRWRATLSPWPPGSSASTSPSCADSRTRPATVSAAAGGSRRRSPGSGAHAGAGAMKLRLGLSTCPNDTFAFHAILERRIDLRGLEFEPEFLDVQQLNDGLFAGRYDVSKASFYEALLLAGDFGVPGPARRSASASALCWWPRGRDPAGPGCARPLPRPDDHGDAALPLPAPGRRRDRACRVLGYRSGAARRRRRHRRAHPRGPADV